MTQYTTEVFPLLWSDDPAAVAEWAKSALGLTEAWRAADDDGRVEHVELIWPGGRVSINIRTDATRDTGPSGISLRNDDRAAVEAAYQRAVDAGAEIIQGPEDSRIAFSFTARDMDGNQWWVNAENGMLDGLRRGSGR